MFGPWGTAIGAGVGAVAGGLASRKSKQKNNYDALIQQLLQAQMQQYQSQQPMRDAVQGMAMNRLRAVYPGGMPGAPGQTNPMEALMRQLTQGR
jgi:hypothetical protein